jgi:hypothetical protein
LAVAVARILDTGQRYIHGAVSIGKVGNLGDWIDMIK